MYVGIPCKIDHTQQLVRNKFFYLSRALILDYWTIIVVVFVFVFDYFIWSSHGSRGSEHDWTIDVSNRNVSLTQWTFMYFEATCYFVSVMFSHIVCIGLSAFCYGPNPITRTYEFNKHPPRKEKLNQVPCR